MKHDQDNPAAVLAEHLARCTDADAAIVADGNADEIVTRLTAAGWTLHARTDHALGKRIRYLSPPGEEG